MKIATTSPADTHKRIERSTVQQQQALLRKLDIDPTGAKAQALIAQHGHTLTMALQGHDAPLVIRDDGNGGVTVEKNPRGAGRHPHDRLTVSDEAEPGGGDPHAQDTRCRPVRRHGHRGHPLHIACAKGHAGIVKVLLDAGAHPDVEDSRGRSALNIALFLQQTEIVAMLRTRGTKPSS